MRIDANQYDCAATYLFRQSLKVETFKKSKNDIKMEAERIKPVTAVHTGKQFNKNAGGKSNFSSHIDISI